MNLLQLECNSTWPCTEKIRARSFHYSPLGSVRTCSEQMQCWLTVYLDTCTMFMWRAKCSMLCSVDTKTKWRVEKERQTKSELTKNHEGCRIVWRVSWPLFYRKTMAIAEAPRAHWLEGNQEDRVLIKWTRLEYPPETSERNLLLLCLLMKVWVPSLVVIGTMSCWLVDTFLIPTPILYYLRL